MVAVGWQESSERRCGFVTDRVQAESTTVHGSMKVGAVWLWCLAGSLGAWYVVIWLMELTLW